MESKVEKVLTSPFQDAKLEHDAGKLVLVFLFEFADGVGEKQQAVRMRVQHEEEDAQVSLFPACFISPLQSSEHVQWPFKLRLS